MSNNIDRNEYVGLCQQCGTKRISKVDGVDCITIEELAEIQDLYCRHCDDGTPHRVVRAGGGTESPTVDLEWAIDQHFDGMATEKLTRELLIRVGISANQHGLADFAVDQMFEDARQQLKQGEYDLERLKESGSL